jgi:hypothetical protein
MKLALLFSKVVRGINLTETILDKGHAIRRTIARRTNGQAMQGISLLLISRTLNMNIPNTLGTLR